MCTAKSLSHGRHIVTSILVTTTPFFETTAFATLSIASASEGVTKSVGSGKLVLSADEKPTAFAEVTQSWAFTQIAGFELIFKQLLFVLDSKSCFTRNNFGIR